MKACMVALAAFAFVTTYARASITVPGANGSDGLFTVGNALVDLSQAPVGAWDSMSPQPGKGVYDPDKWAVVFHYTSVSITGNVGFKNNATHAPVVWLVNGDVTISGTLNVSGNGTEPGPGGFRGSAGGANTGGGGFGPGGPNATDPFGDPASYATQGTFSTPGATYGNSRILPLIGGSGGSLATQNRYQGGAGGGAILIAATGTITINGRIYALGANGGTGQNGGSGGAIRLVADTVTGTGSLVATGGGGGGTGRIRIEAINRGTGLTIDPVASGTSTVTTAELWPPASDATARIVSVGNETVPADPKAAFNLSDVAPDVSSTLPVVIATTNVPTTATVNLRVVPVSGAATTVKATFTSGDQNSATWTAQIVPAAGTSALQARVETQ